MSKTNVLSSMNTCTHCFILRNTFLLLQQSDNRERFQRSILKTQFLSVNYVKKMSSCRDKVKAEPSWAPTIDLYI